MQSVMFWRQAGAGQKWLFGPRHGPVLPKSSCLEMRNSPLLCISTPGYFKISWSKHQKHCPWKWVMIGDMIVLPTPIAKTWKPTRDKALKRPTVLLTSHLMNMWCIVMRKERRFKRPMASLIKFEPWAFKHTGWSKQNILISANGPDIRSHPYKQRWSLYLIAQYYQMCFFGGQQL